MGRKDDKAVTVGFVALGCPKNVVDSEKMLAKGEVICVTYNFRNKKTTPVPPEWRNKIAEFEGRSFD